MAGILVISMAMAIAVTPIAMALVMGRRSGDRLNLAERVVEQLAVMAPAEFKPVRFELL
ncbi:MAG: hypothetical protein QW050_01095 [Candidatus Nitrosocaldaceae archaeon]